MEKEQLERYLGRRLVEQEKVWGITSPAVDANCFSWFANCFVLLANCFVLLANSFWHLKDN